jgi:hypothetical protein
MRQALTVAAFCFVLVLQGCGLKTSFGGSIPTEGNQSSSGGSGSQPVSRKAFLWTEEATSSHYDVGLEWSVHGGDWEDVDGVDQGSVPFASVPLIDDDLEKVIDVDVTSYVARFGADFRFNQRGGTSYEFHSRESFETTKRPRLVVERGAQVILYEALADTTINRSLSTSRGAFPTLSTADGFLLRFDVTLDASVTKVSVRLTSTNMQYGDQFLELYRP